VVLLIDAFLSHFKLLMQLLAGLRSALIPHLADELHDLFGEIGRDGGTRLLALEHYFNELGLLLAVVIEGEPVVEVLRGDAPAVSDAIGGMQHHVVNVSDEDGLGSGQREVVLVDDQHVLVEHHLAVLVKRVHPKYAYKVIQILFVHSL
jgi:hypothetical protein